ncbi:hypothetical protein ACFLZN_00890 [Nanoarchaeota archaeon]
MTESFYVGIKDPKEFKRNLISSHRTVCEAFLSSHEEYSKVKKDKIEQIEELKKRLDDMIFLTKKLRSALPKGKTAARPVKKHTVKTVKGKKKRVVKKRRTRLDQIREKLSNMDDELHELEGY